MSSMTREEYLAFFEKTCARMLELTKAKNADYAASSDPFANFKMVESLGICSVEVGFLTRMSDKLSRISSFVKRGELSVKDESVTDTLQDLAVYSILMMAYLKQKNQLSASQLDAVKDRNLMNLVNAACVSEGLILTEGALLSLSKVVKSHDAEGIKSWCAAMGKIDTKLSTRLMKLSAEEVRGE